jgi:hypothetical protein
MQSKLLERMVVSSRNKGRNYTDCDAGTSGLAQGNFITFASNLVSVLVLLLQ